MRRIVEAVNDIYAERKIATLAADLPSQDLKTGTLRIGIVEDKLGKVEIESNSALRSNDLQRRFGGTPDDGGARPARHCEARWREAAFTLILFEDGKSRSNRAPSSTICAIRSRMGFDRA